MASSSRRPPSAASRWASRRTASSSGNRTSAGSSPSPAVEVDLRPAPLTSTSVTPGQAQQRLERPGADHVAAQRLVDREHGRRRRPGARSRAAPRRPGAGSAPRGSRASRSRTSSRRAQLDRQRTCATAVMPPRRSRRQPGQHLGRGPAERAAPGAHRPQAEVDGLVEPALVGHLREPPAPWSAAATASARTPVAAHHQPQRGRVARTARTGVPAEATPATVGTDQHQHPVAAGDHLLDQRVDAAGQVDAPRVSWPRWAAESASRTAKAWSAPVRPGVPGQHAQPVAPRQRLAQRPRAEPAGGLAQRVPADAVDAVEPEHPVDARPERVGVDDHGRARSARPPGASAHANVVAPAPPEPPTTPTRHARARRRRRRRR